MFVKSSKEPEQPVSQPQQPPPPLPRQRGASAPAQPKRAGLRNGTPSIISADLIVSGALFSAGDVQIDGRVDGDIRAGGLIVGEKAIIVGDVYAEEIVVRGRVEGGISARKVSLSVDLPRRRQHPARSAGGRNRRLFRRQLPPLRQSAGECARERGRDRAPSGNACDAVASGALHRLLHRLRSRPQPSAEPRVL